MNDLNRTPSAEFAAGLARELRAFLALCGDFLALAAQENQALAGTADYQPFGFHQRRKHLISPLESALIKLREFRLAWQQCGPPAESAQSEEIKSLFQDIQNLMMKILLLDRENQQAMLRRGMVPPAHLPAVAAEQRPHFVAGLYQRFSPR